MILRIRPSAGNESMFDTLMSISLNEQAPLVLVTGATGYIGGRLVPRLLDAGMRVRCLVRDAARLQGRAWRDKIELIEGDVLREDS